MKNRVNHKKTQERWINTLHQIKYELDNNEITSILPIIRNNNVCSRWNIFLKKNKIIYKENEVYKWNEKIPVSYKIIQKFRDYVSEKNKSYVLQRKQEANLFNMPQTPLPKPPRVIKTRTPKVEVQVNDKPKSELGVIRKFLKWLW